MRPNRLHIQINQFDHIPLYKNISSNYRYSFNGKENDSEIKGSGNSQDYGFRIYDPRLGRFLSVDPLTKDYPELTPYQFASNSPIQAIDLDGLEGFQYTEKIKGENGNTTTKRIIELDIHIAVKDKAMSSHFKSSDIPTIQSNLNSEFNNKGFVDNDGNQVEFRFNIKEFDATKISPTDFAKNLKRSRENRVDVIDGLAPRGGVLARKNFFLGGEGQTETDISYSKVNRNASNQSHTIAHEISHLLMNYDSNNNPKTEKQHNNAGGIFTYGKKKEKGENFKKTSNLNQDNVKKMLKSLPEAKPKGE